jgi:hypothetical protein
MQVDGSKQSYHVLCPQDHIQEKRMPTCARATKGTKVLTSPSRLRILLSLLIPVFASQALVSCMYPMPTFDNPYDTKRTNSVGGPSARTITVDGNPSDWQGITPSIRDPVGDTAYSFMDIKSVSMAYDAAWAYFLVELANDYSGAHRIDLSFGFSQLAGGPIGDVSFGHVFRSDGSEGRYAIRTTSTDRSTWDYFPESSFSTARSGVYIEYGFPRSQLPPGKSWMVGLGSHFEADDGTSQVTVSYP